MRRGPPRPARRGGPPAAALRRDALDDDVPGADEHVGVVRTWTLPSSTRPSAGAALAVTVPGTVHIEPAGRNALASVTLTEPKPG